MTQHRNRTAGWIANVLLVAGAICVTVWAGVFLSRIFWQVSQNRAFDQQRAAAPESHKEGVELHVENGGIVGRLGIPRLHVHAMLSELKQ